MSYQGDLIEDQVLYFAFTSRDTDGVPYTLAGTPSLAVYKSGGTTPTAAGVSLAVDFGAVTGLNMVEIATAANEFYAAEADYTVVIAAGTVNGNSVVGEIVGSFSIENRYQPVSAARAAYLDKLASAAAFASLLAIDMTGETDITKLLGQIRMINAHTGGNVTVWDPASPNVNTYRNEADSADLSVRTRTTAAGNVRKITRSAP